MLKSQNQYYFLIHYIRNKRIFNRFIFLCVRWIRSTHVVINLIFTRRMPKKPDSSIYLFYWSLTDWMFLLLSSWNRLLLNFHKPSPRSKVLNLSSYTTSEWSDLQCIFGFDWNSFNNIWKIFLLKDVVKTPLFERVFSFLCKKLSCQIKNSIVINQIQVTHNSLAFWLSAILDKWFWENLKDFPFYISI